MAILGIDAASRLTALSPFTIRAWEMRYGVPQPRRDARGRRVYSKRDIYRLMLLARNTRTGHRVGEIARMSDVQLRSLLGTRKGRFSQSGAAGLRLEIMDAVERYRVGALCAALQNAVTGLPPLAAIHDVLTPVLHEIGDRWRAGKASIAQEHLLTSCVERAVYVELHRLEQRAGGPPLICGTLAGEQHSLGCLLAAYLASAVGYSVYVVGANLPAAEFRRLMDQSAAGLALVSVVTDECARRLAPQLDQLCENMSSRARVVIGGRASSTLQRKRMPVQCSVLGSMDELLELLLDQV